MTQLEPDLPGDYSAALTTLKALVREAQHRAQRVVNTAMIELYWNIGHTILERQLDQPWGSKVLDRIARDLRAEFPHMKGFSRTNMYNMRAFAAAWSGGKPGFQMCDYRRFCRSVPSKTRAWLRGLPSLV